MGRNRKLKNRSICGRRSVVFKLYKSNPFNTKTEDKK